MKDMGIETRIEELHKTDILILQRFLRFQQSCLHQTPSIPNYFPGPIHLLLASEAFSKTIRILATSFGKQYSFGNGEAAFKFMRTPSKLGAPSNHLVPLVRDDSLSSRYPTTRSKPSSPCAAADQCAVLVRVNPSLTFLQCRHCLRDFHSTCAISEEVGTADSVWFCGCAYEAEDLKQ